MRVLRGAMLLICLSLSMSLVTACSPQMVEDPGDSVVRLRISGSGTALPLLQVLTEAYDGEDVEFVYLPGLHSGGGIRGVANGDLEIGCVSRELSTEEADIGLDYTKLSDDGLVVAVHPSVTIDHLTSEQVRGIYSGVYDNWSDLGGPDLDIVVLDRNEDESAKIILREYLLGDDLVVTSQAVNLFYESDMVDGVRQTPGAIGYFSLGYGISEKIPVTYVALDGVSPGVGTIESGDYPMIRPLGVVCDQGADEEARLFLDWATGDEARTIMVAQGFAPPTAQD